MGAGEGEEQAEAKIYLTGAFGKNLGASPSGHPYLHGNKGEWEQWAVEIAKDDKRKAKLAAKKEKREAKQVTKKKEKQEKREEKKQAKRAAKKEKKEEKKKEAKQAAN